MQGLSTFLGVCSSVTPLSTFSQSLSYHSPLPSLTDTTPGSPGILISSQNIRLPPFCPAYAGRQKKVYRLASASVEAEGSSAGSISFSTEAETDSLLVCSLDSVLLSEEVLLEDEVLSALLSELL